MVRKMVCALLAAALVCCALPERAGAFEAGAKGVVVMEAASGRVLYEKDAHTRLPMASTTKIMTALLALEQPDVDEEFTVDASAIYVEGSSMGLCEGDTVTLRSLAAGMLLASGNDAANAAAVRIDGSVEKFVQRMNERAAALGLENTSFETPSGLDGDEHYSTAYDMALLARAALQNPDFAAICGQSRMKISFGNPPYERWLRNHNRLLNQYEGAVGVKTGFTKTAGRCLVSAAQRDGVTLICVTLSCPDDWATHRALLDEAFASLTSTELSGALPTTLAVGGGVEAEVPLRTAAPLSVVLRGEESGRVQVEVALERFLLAPVEEGRTVGEVRVTLDGAELLRTPVLTGAAVEARPVQPKKPSLWQRFCALFGGGNTNNSG